MANRGKRKVSKHDDAILFETVPKLMKQQPCTAGLRGRFLESSTFHEQVSQTVGWKVFTKKLRRIDRMPAGILAGNRKKCVTPADVFVSHSHFSSRFKFEQALGIKFGLVMGPVLKRF